MRKVALLSLVCLMVVGYTAVYAGTVYVPFSQVGTASANETIVIQNTSSSSMNLTVTLFAKSSTPGAVGSSVGSTSRTVVAGGNWSLTGGNLAVGAGITSTSFQGYATISDGSSGAGITDVKLWGAVFFASSGLIAGFPLADISASN